VKVTNRREFLKQAAAVGAVAANAGATQSRSDPQGAPGPVHAWRTSKEEKFQPVPSPPEWESWTGPTPQGVHLEPGTLHQEILGFGGAFTDASCYLFHQMSSSQRHSLLAELYGPEGLRLSVGRTCIGSSDYSTKMYNYDEDVFPDPELKRFTIEHDHKWILPTLREAREMNPDLFLFSCVWSPPGWMKAGGSMLGGSMRQHWFAPHAQYFVKFLQAYAAAGVKVQAVTVNNEVDTDQDGNFPATLWGQQYEMGFVMNHLGPAFEQASLDTKIWILDHNYNLWGRAVDELSNEGVYKYVDGVAWHSYAGSPDAMTRVHNMFPEKHMYFTEGGIPAHLFSAVKHEFHFHPYGTDWADCSSAFADILRNWARCICVWNLVLDQDGRPDITNPPRARRPGGFLCINTQSQEITRSGAYYALAHYSKAIQRGAHILASSGNIPGVDHVAAQNPDGSRVLVVTNRSKADEQRAQYILGPRALTLALPPDSITSLVW
jgi:glucosylceramidase